ncbi:hypothetical protein BC835DRAFT_1270944 [Cytidiella melzeri]|nr:hypothetical protein BC835DRAFT_1270944 [Cytidiella melzeri]
MQNISLCVARPSSGLNPHEPVLVSSPKPQVPENHVLIEIDRFGFSANNVTYQALGETPHFRYFEYNYPPTVDKVSSKSHGLIPVWGFGTVVETAHPHVPVNERVYGYFAPSRYLLVPVSNVNKYKIHVPRPHLPADRRPYNTIDRCASDPQYDPSPMAEDLTMLYRPLFWTAYWFEDWLYVSKYRGATGVLISSASAKTAFCLAYLLKKRRGSGANLKIIGLTSKRNVAFTTGLGLYDETLDYDSIETAEPLQARNEKWLYVDVAGSKPLTERVRKHFSGQKNVVAGIQLGLTTLSPSAPAATTIHFSTNTSLVEQTDAAPTGDLELEQFFMPEWLVLRQRQMSIGEITGMQTKAWRELMEDGKNWVRIERTYGAHAVVDAYKTISASGTDPTAGMIWSLWDISPVLGRGERKKSRL